MAIRLRELRKEKGLTQAELAQVVHSELLQEYMELDKREEAILKQIMGDSNAT